MPNTFIIIPHYNNWNLTHARLWELYKHCSSAEIIVVDDCSVDTMTEGGLRWWVDFGKKHNFKITFIQTPQNLNFLGASNLGLSDTVSKCSPEDIIILLSNDVEIRTNFVQQVADIISRGGKVMIGGILLSHDTGWNKFGDRVFPYLEGWLLGATARSWKELGMFDDRFAPSDFEDVDLSTTALSMGYELVPINNPGLHHIGGQSIGYNPERLARTNENKVKFQEKWIGENENTSFI